MSRKPQGYWEKRQTELMKRIEKGTENTIDSLIKAYEQATKNINKEISNIFKNYAKNSELSEKVLKQLLNKKETEQYYNNLLELINNKITDENIKKKLLTKYNAPAYSYRISRYEALQQNIDIELKSLANIEQNITELRYVDTIKEGYYHTIYNTQKATELGFSFAEIDNKTIKLLLNENWVDDANFSQRIWKNSEKLGNYLRTQLTADTMSGKSVQRIASELASFMNVGLYNATTLVRTEVNHFANEAEMLAYEELDIEKYRFIATLDKVTCDHCGELDNKVFNVKDRKPGKNYPPIHPNDRCTTVAEFDDNVMDELTRRAKDEDGKTIVIPQDITYKQWSEEYKPKLILEQGKSSKLKEKMNYQERHETLESTIIKPSVYANKSTSYRIQKYQNKIMDLYYKNGNENMCILDIETGKLIGDITEGQEKTTVGLNISTAAKLLTKKKNTVIAIHNHPENYTFSLTDIKTYNKLKQIDTMILLTDDYTYYLNGKTNKYTSEYLEKLYKTIEKETKKTYNQLNGVERSDLTNQKFFKKVGWVYEKEKN